MENSYLMVGLGNPGSEYAGTRHNAGFLALDRLADRWRVDWSAGKKFHSRLARLEREGRRLLLAQPQTFMNASGEAVKALVDFYRVTAGRLVVVVDDADLPLGEIRLRPGGSSGGHHGLESVEQHVGTREFARLRIGIGRTERAGRAITGHVLGAFTAAERELLEKVLTRAGDQLECWWRDGIQKAMSQFNGAINSDTKA